VNPKIISIDPLADARWENFVSRHPHGGLAHSSSWLEILQHSYGYKPAHLAYEEDGVLRGILPLLQVRSALTGKRLVSLPFSGPAGPLGTSQIVVDALVGGAMEMTSELGCSYLKLSGRGDWPPPSETRLAVEERFMCSIVPLTDPSRVWAGIPQRKVRQEIRRAERRGVVVRASYDREDLARFYELAVQTFRKHGIPPQPYGMFESMWDVLQRRDMISLFLATLDGRVINAMLCVSFKKTVSAAYVGTDYKFINYHPVKLLDWTAIEWACKNGYTSFDFLQSHIKNAGLRWYKRSFGAVEIPMVDYYYPSLGGADRLRERVVGGGSTLSKVMRAVVRRVPPAALEVVGRLVFKHVG
jgi:CelD/BcsL family acetyltransferase involved in cellulose biosynthesis